MRCRRCDALLQADPALRLGVRASRYKELVFRCSDCGVGYSNATTESDRTEITMTPDANVPLEVQDGLHAALAAAVNVIARPGKRWKFSFGTSEDAVTWTVMRALQATRQLGRVADALGLGHLTAGDPPGLLLWGAPAPGCGAEALSAAGVVEQISTDLGENPKRRSEPDVIVVWDDLIVVIEAKLGSGNDRQTKNLDRFDRYLRREEMWTETPEAIRAAGFYELARNWVVAWELAERRDARCAVLVNLAPAGHAEDVARFRGAVATSETRRVEHLPWGHLLADPTPDWLEQYAARLHLRAL